ncbi:unnamed protein product, partial [Cladocopium goreaui]
TLASEVPGMWETTHPSCHCGHRNGVRSMGSRSESTTTCANTSSWLSDVTLQRYEATLEVAGFRFQLLLRQRRDPDPGWLRAMPWRIGELSLDLTGLERLTALLRRLDGRPVAWRPTAAALRQRWTEAPKPLTEAELVELMDQHGIGTDASIPQHIQTIQDRRYVQLVDGQGQPIVATHRGGPQGPKGPKGQRAPKRAPGRFLVPTARGLALVRGLSTCDATLCEPEVRALIERECAMVATAELTSAEVLRRNVALFQGKFQRVAGAMNEVRSFFETAPNAQSGEAKNAAKVMAAGDGGSRDMINENHVMAMLFLLFRIVVF